MYTEEELLAKRQQLEQELRDAELLLGLIRKHLEAADRLIGELKPPPAPSVRTARRVTEAHREEILRCYRDGETLTAIAKITGYAISTISRLLRREGLETSLTKRRRMA